MVMTNKLGVELLKSKLVSSTITDWNNLTTPGLYWVDRVMDNRPSNDFCLAFVTANPKSGVYYMIHQIAIRDDANVVWIRKYGNGVWGTWYGYNPTT